MEELDKIINESKSILEKMIDLKIKNNAIGASLINIFESVSKFNDDNKNFIIGLFKEHEAVYEDVISSFENPDCSCRKRFMDFLKQNPEVSKNAFVSLLSFLNEKDREKIARTLKNFYEHYEATSKEEQKQAEAESPAIINQTAKTNEVLSVVKVNPELEKNYAGKSFLIEKNQEAYSRFFEELKASGVQYNGMSVVSYNLSHMMVLFY
jgi:hypothetical protein